MMPTNEQLAADTNRNFKKLFDDKKIKLSKKAKEVILSLLRETITLKYKLITIKNAVNHVERKPDESQNKEA
jgi:hypothetical protein